MQFIRYPQQEQIRLAFQRPSFNTEQLREKVSSVLQEIKLKGDEALIKYTLLFDKVDLKKIQVSPEEIDEAIATVPESLKQAIQQAHQNIFCFHSAQKEESKLIETMPGVQCWRKSIGIEKVGLYIPGGSAPLFSTILMLAIPAQIAGCKEIILCTPPSENGKIHPAILYTAQLAGVTNIYKLGGVQAIGAMAYGTATVPSCYKIFGPGNQYVTCAKQLVNLEGISIDMPAGPSELAILADESAVPAYLAADLLSQAEHGADSQVILVSNQESIIQETMLEIERQLTLLPRKEVAIKALANSTCMLVNNMEEGMSLLNQYAPEHLIIACSNAAALSEQVVNAGSVFIGNYSCESAGDYASGTNHTLPTSGHAKTYSGVSLDSFVKKITFQHLSASGLASLAPAIELMAEAEGLQAHKNAVRIRSNSKSV